MSKDNDGTVTLPALPGADSKVSQMMILKNDMVDTKIAELERNLRDQKSVLEKKVTKLQEQRSSLQTEEQVLQEKVLRPYAEKEVKRIFKGLKALFKYSSDVDKISLADFLGGDDISENRVYVREDLDDDGEIEGWWASMYLNYSFGEDNHQDEAAYYVVVDGRRKDHNELLNLKSTIINLTTEIRNLNELSTESLDLHGLLHDILILV